MWVNGLCPDSGLHQKLLLHSAKKNLSSSRWGLSGLAAAFLSLLLQQDLYGLFAIVGVDRADHSLQTGEKTLTKRWGTADEFEVGGTACGTGHGQLVHLLGWGTDVGQSDGGKGQHQDGERQITGHFWEAVKRGVRKNTVSLEM